MMNETVLIKSEPYNLKRVLIITLVACASLMAIVYLVGSSNFGQTDTHDYYEYWECDRNGHKVGRGEGMQHQYYCIGHDAGETYFEYRLRELLIIDNYDFDWAFENVCTYLGPFILLMLVSIYNYLLLRSCQMTVTDKRVYGKLAFGKQVDLPIDSVSATATLELFKGVSVSTSSGRINFLMMKNSKQIYEVISNLIIERQQSNQNSVCESSNSGVTEQLKKYKDLLDSGVITQEEFDAKKKQLLGL